MKHIKNPLALDGVLSRWGKYGYRLVSTEMAKNTYGATVMYLFFTRREDNE